MNLTVQKYLSLAVVLLSVLYGTSSFATNGDVKNSVHNFAAGGGSATMVADTEQQVCIFCHTPHHASSVNPLWNKAVANGNFSAYAASFRLYTSSATLTATAKAAAFTADSPSLLCLSCHDGKTAMNVLHSASTGTDASGSYGAGTVYLDVTGATTMPEQGTWDFFSSTYGPSNNLGMASDGSDPLRGDDLTNDHPVGFSYTNAQAQSAGRLNNTASLDPSIRFFGTGNTLECSSCHNPHNKFFKPFLVMSNTGSALCLSCHNK